MLLAGSSPNPIEYFNTPNKYSAHVNAAQHREHSRVHKHTPWPVCGAAAEKHASNLDERNKRARPSTRPALVALSQAF